MNNNKLLILLSVLLLAISGNAQESENRSLFNHLAQFVGEYKIEQNFSHGGAKQLGRVISRDIIVHTANGKNKMERINLITCFANSGSPSCSHGDISVIIDKNDNLYITQNNAHYAGHTEDELLAHSWNARWGDDFSITTDEEKVVFQNISLWGRSERNRTITTLTFNMDEKTIRLNEKNKVTLKYKISCLSNPFNCGLPTKNKDTVFISH